jgi:hypothetical protein
LHFDAGAFRLRFPMVVAPRYVPGDAVGEPDAGTGWAAATDQVPDAPRITPPVAHPAEGAINPVTLVIDLNPGFPLAKLDSPYHAITVRESPGGRHRIELAGGAVPAGAFSAGNACESLERSFSSISPSPRSARSRRESRSSSRFGGRATETVFSPEPRC